MKCYKIQIITFHIKKKLYRMVMTQTSERPLHIHGLMLVVSRLHPIHAFKPHNAMERLLNLVHPQSVSVRSPLSVH